MSEGFELMLLGYGCVALLISVYVLWLTFNLFVNPTLSIWIQNLFFGKRPSNVQVVRKVVGDRGKAICPICQRLVDATYCIRDLPYRHPVVEKDLLVLVCDHCDTICGIPHQSIQDKLDEKRE